MQGISAVSHEFAASHTPSTTSSYTPHPAPLSSTSYTHLAQASLAAHDMFGIVRPVTSSSLSSSDSMYDTGTMDAMMGVDLTHIEANYANNIAIQVLVNFLEHWKVYSSAKPLSTSVKWVQALVRAGDWSPESVGEVKEKISVEEDDLDELIELTVDVLRTNAALVLILALVYFSKKELHIFIFT
jgi:hypothetical protein